MENNIKVSRAHRILAVLYGVLAAIFVACFFVDIAQKDAWIFLLPVILYLAMMGIHVFVAKGAYEKKDSARMASRIIGGLMILGFPIGTIIGVYLLTNSQSWNTTPIAIPVNNSPADPGVWPPPPTSSTV